MIRFLVEAAFIVLIAAAAAIAHLGKLWIALAVGAAWVLVALVERSVQSEDSRLREGRFGFLFGQAKPEAPQEPAEPELPPPPPPPPPPPSHVTVLGAEEPDPEPEPEPEGEPEPVQLEAVPDLPEPEPEPEPPPPPEAEPEIVQLPRAEGPPREWNVWELERIAREREGHDQARDEELAFLLIELRQFANADGYLPVTFDPVVREAFGDDLYTAV